MATYWYLLLNVPEKLPRASGRIPVDEPNDSSAESWIIANDPQYNPTTSRIYLQRKSALEADDQGIASITHVGANTDAAVAAGAAGTINAKLRLITSQLNSLLTTGNNVTIAGAPTGVTAIQNQGTIAPGSPPVGFPLYIAGSDGSNLRAIKTRSDGSIVIDPLGTTTQPVSLAAAIPAGTNLIGNVLVKDANRPFYQKFTPFGQSYNAVTTRILNVVLAGSTLDPIITSNVANGATTVVSNGVVRLATNTSANGSAGLVTTKVARYLDGSVHQFYTRLQLGTTAANNTRRWGMYDANNGIFFELVSNTIGIVTRKGGVDTRVTSLNGTVPTIDTNFHDWEILYHNGRYDFYQDGVLAHQEVETTAVKIYTLSLPVSFDNFNSGGSSTAITMDMVAFTVNRHGDHHSEPLYVKLSSSTTVTLKNSPGKLHRVIVNGLGSSTPTVTIYDNIAASGTPVAIIDTSNKVGSIEYQIDLNTGLTVVTSATVGDITLVYE